MAMLDKLIVEFNGDSELVIDLNNLSAEQILFEFNENTNVQVKKNSTRYKVSVELFDVVENEDIDSSHNPPILDKYMVNLNSNWTHLCDAYNSFYPGNYLIKIFDIVTEKTIYKHFKVKSLITLDKNNMFNKMIDVISSYSKSFLYDYSRKKLADALELKDYNDSIVNKIMSLKDSFDIINSALVNIKYNPIFNLTKNIIKSNKSGRQNTKCFIKAAIKNQDNYILKTIETYDTFENSVLKFYLQDSSNILTMISETIDKTIRIYHELIEEKDRDIIALSNFKNIKEEKKQRFIKEKSDIQRKLDLFLECKDIVYKYLYMINTFLYNSFLSSIRINTTTLTQKFVNNVNYYLIYTHLYSVLKLGLTSKKPVSGSTSLTYTYKSTSTLYEIYCLLFIVKIIENNGFFIDRTKLSDNIKNMEIIESKTYFYFTNGNINIKLIYDKNVETIDSDTREKDELIYPQPLTHHNTPDFQILFFDENERYLNGIILDSKCRRYNSISLEEGRDFFNLKCQLFDYMNFRYLEEGDSLIDSKLAVKEVVLLTPDIDLIEPVKNSKYGIRYFPIKPDEVIEETNDFKEFDKFFKHYLNDLS